MLTSLQVGQFRALIRPFPYTDHLIETAGPRRRAMVARLRELAHCLSMKPLLGEQSPQVVDGQANGLEVAHRIALAPRRRWTYCR